MLFRAYSEKLSRNQRFHFQASVDVLHQSTANPYLTGMVQRIECP